MKIKLLWLSLVILAGLSLFAGKLYPTYAICNGSNPLCDAPAGECASTCDGGGTCVIGRLTVYRTEACYCENTGRACLSVTNCNPADPYDTCSNCVEVNTNVCYDEIWTTCCSPGTPPTPTPIPSDPPPPDPSDPPLGCDPVVADIKADASDGPITVESNQVYTLSWTSTFATACDLEGVSKPTSGSTTDVQTVSGTYNYDLTCTSACDSDVDRVTVDVVGSCGDAACTGFETCLSCPGDCGVCPAYFSWWQAWGGHVGAEGSGYAIQSPIPSDTLCIEPFCYPYLSALDRAGTANSDGIPIVDGGVSANGRISARTPDVYAIDTTKTRLEENYAFFYRQYSLGLSPTEDFLTTAGDAQKPAVTQDYYFHSGDMTVQSAWAVAAGESYVVFVDGNLTISDPGGVDELITVAEGGFLAFIVSGNITVSSNVGHSVLGTTTGNVEGIYLADGTLTITTNAALDERFVGEGTFVGWTDVDLQRDYNGGADNDLYPAETFIYRPDFVKNTPEIMKRSQMLWQETN